MLLKKLTLRNFQGIRDFVFEPNGDDGTIYGSNATGKTTLFNSFTWLLTDKNSLNDSNFGIKTLAGGVPVGNIDHEVEGVFDVGREITLRKVFREVWTKKRGSAQASFTGHETLYFVNDVPVKLKGFTEKIADIARPELFRLLTSPRYVNEEMKWEARRRLLIDICGDVSDGDVMATNPVFQKIAVMLGDKKSADEYRQEIAYRKQGINKELTAIPVRIDELSKTLPAGDQLPDAGKLIAEKAELDSRLSVLRNELSMIESGGAVGIKKNELLNVQNQIQALEIVAAKEAEKEAARLRGVAKYCEESLGNARDKEAKIKVNIDALAATITSNESQMVTLRAQWAEKNKETFVAPTVTCNCHVCGALPEHQVNFSTEKAEADFNQKKAEALKGIQVNGRQLADQTDTMKIQKLKLATDMQDARNLVEACQQDFENAQKAVVAPVSMEITPEHAALIEKVRAIDAELGELAIGGHDAAAEVYTKIDEAEKSLENVVGKLATINEADKTRTRINDLMAQEKTIAAEYERLESDLQLLEEFTRAKCSMLTTRINSKFQVTRWLLYENQINGGMKDCCIATVDGVPYGDLNNAARINCGIDIINALSEYHGISLPLFIDNAESIVETLPTNSQTIRLVVSAEDKFLRTVCHVTDRKAA